MKLRTWISPLWAPFFLTSAVAFANNAPKKTPVDNSAVNERDRGSATLTPMDQLEGSPADVETTRLVRQALVDEPNLSVYAQNVKIITLNGNVTLRGPVHTLDEKVKIAALAKRVAGTKKTVVNELEVKK